MTITGNFERFQCFNFESDFLENKNLFQKAGIPFFSWKHFRLKTHHFHIKLPYQKPVLKQIKWWVQTGPITKNGILPVATQFFWKFCFSLSTSYKELIWCTNDLNAHIPTFLITVVLFDGTFSLWESLTLNIVSVSIKICRNKNWGKVLFLHILWYLKWFYVGHEGIWLPQT